jgi:demethylmenaquinone methyltransferase/2-methoxy-6-polyprenyl-1,4-benzoquinol methylase
MRPGNYAEQAKTYDLTRRASPTILGALCRALGDGRARRLLDVAGGTGNYAAELAQAGFRVVVADAAPAMLARAAVKLGPGSAVGAEAAALPFRDASFDCATLISALHLFADKPAALREVRRVVRDGPFVMQVFTRENLVPLLTQGYFDHPLHDEVRETEAEHVELVRAAGFRVESVQRLAYHGVEDGSLSALQTDAALVADERNLRNTSYWHRMDEATRERGMRRLREDLASGELERKVRRGVELAQEWGHVTVLVARPF